MQLTGDAGAFRWLGGVLYFHESGFPFNAVPVNGQTIGLPDFIAQGYEVAGHAKTESVAPYIRLTYAFSDKLSVTGGERYNNETKTIDDTFEFDFSRPYSPTNPVIAIPPFPRHAEATFNQATPSVVVNYQAAPTVFLYASATQGFKSGGFNVGADQPAYSPEKIWAYETGVKSSLLNNTLEINLAGFYYDYTDLQVTVIRGTAILVENAAKAKLHGIDANIRLKPVDGLDLNLGYTLVQSAYHDYESINPDNPAAGEQDLSGNQLAQAPKNTLILGAQIRLARV